MDNYEYLRYFSNENPWFKSSSFFNFHDSTEDHYHMMDLCDSGWSLVVGGVDPIRFVSEVEEYELKDLCKYFKDITKPTVKEKEMFHMLFGWEIPWSEECPLVL